MVTKELEDNNWVRAIQSISTREELLEYITLWRLLSGVNLNNAANDSVVWKWRADGTYSTALAYKIQFQGSLPSFQVGKLWKTKIEPKVKVFGWTAMHQKILIADNLEARGMQHSPICPLCNQAREDACHLLINCPFTREVLHLLWSWYGLLGSVSTCSIDEDPTSWLCSTTRKALPENQKRASAIILYIWWNAWKERNKRIFDFQQRSELQVAFAAKEKIDLCHQAFIAS
jgi:hypothetical protein